MNKRSKTDKIVYYFCKEKWVLLIVTITGIIYNAGMVAGPWFEGQMVQFLCDIMGGNKKSVEMLKLDALRVLCHQDN